MLLMVLSVWARAAEDPECSQSHCILIIHTLETLRQMALPYPSTHEKKHLTSVSTQNTPELLDQYF